MLYPLSYRRRGSQVTGSTKVERILQRHRNAAGLEFLARCLKFLEPPEASFDRERAGPAGSARADDTLRAGPQAADRRLVTHRHQVPFEDRSAPSFEPGDGDPEW